MTETHATSPSGVPAGAPAFPPGRYGRRRAPRRGRHRAIVALVLVVLATVALAARLYQQYGDPTYDAQVTRLTEITDSQIMIEFRVVVPPGGSAVCTVRARSRAGAEVGHAEVGVSAAPGERSAVTAYRLATTERPFTGEVPRCRAA